MFLLSFLSFFACSPCKQLCADIAQIAEDECGYEITAEMMSDCRKQQSGKSREERQSCRLAKPNLEEWDCDNIKIYFESNNSEPDDDSAVE